MGILTSNPWENAWIIIGLIIAAVMSAGILGGASYLAWTGGLFGDIVSRIVLFIPIAVVMFGFIADMVLGEYHYSAGGFTAIIGMVINKLGGDSIGPALTRMASYMPSMPTFGRTPPPPPPPPGLTAAEMAMLGGQRGGAVPCSLPGFEWLENTFAPQGTVMSMTVLFYILIEMWDTGRTANSLGVGMTTLFVFLLQSVVYVRNDCLSRYTYGKWSLVIALVMGIVFAGSAYGTVKATAKITGSSGTRGTLVPPKNPTAVNFSCPAGTHLSPEGNCVGGVGGSENIAVGQFQGETSAPTDPNDQFVCEAYKDGELITSTIAS